MKVRLKFPHPHAYREWEAYEDQNGFVHAVSEVRQTAWTEHGTAYRQTFSLVVPKEEVEVV